MTAVLLHLLCNFAELLAIIVIFTIVGMGILLPLRLSGRWRHAILLAPLMGMAAFASLGLLRIAVLLVPPYPRWDAGLLLALALASIYAFRRQRRLHGRRIASYLVIPVLFLITFSLAFSRNGYHMLNGFYDELQYAHSAEHMLEHQHTGDAMDSLIPRPDHWVEDYYSRDLCYNQYYRRGAEITLAHVTRWLSIAPQLAFTVLCGVCIFALILAVPAVARISLGISPPFAIGAQAAVALSAYLTLLFVQGSLANVCSMGLFMAANGLGVLAIQKKSAGPAILFGLLGAGVLLFYADVALAGFLIPSGIGISCIVIRDRSEHLLGARLLVGRNVGIAAGVGALFAHRALQSTILASLNHIDSVTASQTLQWGFGADMGGPLASVIGIFSKYESSDANTYLELWVNRSPWTFLGLFFILAVFACLGYFQCRQQRGMGLLAVMAVLLPMCVLFAMELDCFRFRRTAGYLWVYLILGMVSAVYHSKGILRPVAATVLAGVVLLNMRTSVLFYEHVRRYDMSTDPLYRRFDPEDPIWKKLRNQLITPSYSPVLITGFKSSVEPQWLVSGMGELPYFLGSDIQSFWDVMRFCATGIGGVSETDYGFRACPEKANLFKLKYPDWKVLFPDFVRRSERAIVPVDGGYPWDWEPWRDILPARRVYFQSIGWVVYKTEKSLECSGEGLGSLKKDANGLYREMKTRVVLVPREKTLSSHELTIIYDGAPGDLKIDTGTMAMIDDTQAGQTRLRALIKSDLNEQLTIESSREGLKIRKMEWEEILSSPP